ncbi:tetratricopeptide repeat protein [Candidatus Nitrosotenuis cloacae]|uniref:tetratricopeptide repeat protein n=1 Tax=Candidatus Nitrosotenuis cloacae TaxID=1603555 RepID=UPI0022803ABF|nr:tetratricopeptide repeat protein [Candidatus Nitrosotenuis cloacae]
MKDQDKNLPKTVDDKETSLVKADYQKNKLIKKGIHLMADEKLEDAVLVFEQVLRIDPGNVDALLKLGYSKFHLDDYAGALRVYDQILDIDVANSEAWNLKSLVHYQQKNYAKALDCVEKSIESDPTFGMAWYNKACYLSMLNEVPASLEALRRSIEIDVKNAKRAVKDRDFINVRIEEGFRRIVEVVVLESIRQGYHTVGAIVWTTFISKAEVEDSLHKLLEKGLIVKNEKRQGLNKIDTYDIEPELANKVGVEKKSLLGVTKKLPSSIQSLKDISESIQTTKIALEEENVENILKSLDAFIDTNKMGGMMIDQFLEDHREIRLLKVRLEDKGIEYLKENKEKINSLFENLEITVTKKIRN